MNPLFMLLAIPFFFLLIGIELIIGLVKHKKLYRFNDAVTNLNIGVGNQVFNLFFKAGLLAMFVWFYDNFALLDIPVTWWAFLLSFVLFDFLFYWAHRWSHEINFFWGAHVVHHQSEDYNLSVALRQSWFHNIIAFFIFIPLPLIGFPPEVFFAAAGVNTIYQFWIHTKAIKRMPRWFEFIFNTPSHHRVHHGVNPKYIDKNHAGTLIIWDRLFGTFMAEEEEPTYGITTPLKSLNPTWANVHYYVEMWQKAKQMKWADKFRMIFAKPGWLPDYMGGYQAPPEVDESQPITKYDPNANGPLNFYVAAQFLLIAAGLMAFMYYFGEISTFYKFFFLGLIVLSTMICGAIMENKRWVIVAEYVRLALVIAGLNSLYYIQYLDWFMVMLIASGVGFILFNAWFTIGWWLERGKKGGLRIS